MEEGKAGKTASPQGGILYGTLDRTGNHLYVIIISEEKDVFIYKSNAEGLRKPGRNQEAEILEQISKELGSQSITVSYKTTGGNRSLTFEKCSDSEVGKQIAVYLCVKPEKRPQTIPSSFILSLDMGRFRGVINGLDSESIECIKIISLYSKVENCQETVSSSNYLEKKIKKYVITQAYRYKNYKNMDLKEVFNSKPYLKLWNILYEITNNCMLGIFSLYESYWMLCRSKGKGKSLMESVQKHTLLGPNTQITEDIVKRLLYGLYGKILAFIDNNLDKILDRIFIETNTVSLSDYEDNIKDERTPFEDKNMGADSREIYLSINEMIDHIEKLQANNKSTLKPYALAYIIYYIDVLYTTISIVLECKRIYNALKNNQKSNQADIIGKKVIEKAKNLHNEFCNENEESLIKAVEGIIKDIKEEIEINKENINRLQIRLGHRKGNLIYLNEHIKKPFEYLKKIIGGGGKRLSSTYFSYFAHAIYLEAKSDPEKMNTLFSYTREFLEKEPLHVGMFDSFRNYLCKKIFFEQYKGLCEQSLDEDFKRSARKNANKFLNEDAPKLEKKLLDKLGNFLKEINSQNQ